MRPFMKENVHPKYVDAEIRCACGNVIKTRSTKPVIIVGICNACHPFYTGQQKFVDTAGRVDKFQQRMAKTQAAQAAAAACAAWAACVFARRCWNLSTRPAVSTNFWVPV